MEDGMTPESSKLSAIAGAPPGLTSAEARRRLGEFGPNAVADEGPSRGRTFLAKFWAPIPWMLEAALVLQLGLGQYVEAAVVGFLLLFNATLAFVQEGRAGTALAALKRRLAPTALVRRDGEWARLPASELVPGDAIRLPLGAIVPADAAIVSGSVMVDQSMLTGESVPVDANAGDTVHAGSLVRRGQAIAEVTATGAKTYFGRAAELVRVAHSRSTEQAAVFAATRNLAVVNGAVAVLILAYALAIALPPADLIRLGLTALLATIPVALPATFTLSAAFGAQILARRGVLLTRLSAAHEAATMNVLCADKTGTLTRNALEVVDVVAMPGFDRERVLALAASASSDAEQDPIDAAVRRAAAGAMGGGTDERLVRFIPFDPATKTSEAFTVDRDGNEIRITKGAFEVISRMVEAPDGTRGKVDDLAGRGHRVLAVAAGPSPSLRLAGLIALSDPPREDSAALVAALREMGVRTLMVTGDSAVTAAAIARKVGIAGGVCPPERLSDDLSADEFGVFARVVPENKYRLVKALQSRGLVVGMCGDGVNDAPALRQAQMGIAVSTATDVAKAAAGMVMTEPGLAGIVYAVREGRIAFQRLLTYTFNMLVKKVEIVLFLAIGLALTGRAVLTPVLMVLMLMTNDFLAMSLTTDRASASPSPGIWRMRNITFAAVVLGACKLGFSIAVLAIGKYQLGLNPGELQTLAFITLVFGAQGLLYVVREHRHMWSSKPGNWVLASSAADVVIVSALALSGTLMEPLPGRVLAAVFVAAAGFAFILDQVKLPVRSAFKIG
jgi:H+-transporting ATPase